MVKIEQNLRDLIDQNHGKINVIARMTSLDFSPIPDNLKMEDDFRRIKMPFISFYGTGKDIMDYLTSTNDVESAGLHASFY
jgi:hypothetical protein